MFLPVTLAILVAHSQAADPAVLLNAAINEYIEGDPDQARRLFSEILAEGASLPPDVRQDALAYLGDLLYSERDLVAARNVFQALLEEAPDYALDAFHHPPEVCAYFESLRPPRPPPVVLPPPEKKWPALVTVPGGIYYFATGSPVAGVVVGVAQLGGAIGSELTFFRLREQSACLREVEGCNPGDVGLGKAIARDDEEGRRDYIRMQVLNVGFVTLGTGAYLVPLVVETSRWGRQAAVRVGVGPSGMTVAGRF